MLELERTPSNVPFIGIDEDGDGIADTLPVRIQSSNIDDVILQNQASAPGNGTEYTPEKGNKILTIEIVGTSNSRTIEFEMCGPSGVYRAQQCLRLTDNALAASTTNGSDADPESWQVLVPVGWAFRTRVAAVAGGDVSIQGKGVA
jgi:hypothetical protein